jgi:WXXGXW repeat (2 copies)
MSNMAYGFQNTVDRMVDHQIISMNKIKIILALTVGIIILSSVSSSAQVSVGISISANIAPPPLVVYTQPPCPTDGFLWTPGYWAYGDGGYFWVPGVWVRPPQYGYLWTPAYWGYAGGVYGFHSGYWGPHVGFYGGINYGYGYGGSGFYGGRWQGNSFRYNTAVVNVNTTVVHNTYVDRTVTVNNTNNHTSFNGGPGGISARPTAQEETAVRERHVQATAEQTSHMHNAMQDRNQFASVNHGRPATTAMNKPGGVPYNNTHATTSVHNANNAAAPQQHPQASANHAAPQQHPQASANHAAPQQHPQASANHAAPQQHPQADANHAAAQQHSQPNNHPVPQQHQQAYNNHSQPSQQHANQQQQHHPAPQQPHGAEQPHGGSPHP